MYQPLNTATCEIRLLVLIPGLEESQINGTVYVSTLTSADQHWTDRMKPELGDDVEPATAGNWGPSEDYSTKTTSYEALSYEWGDPSGPRHNIILNGQPFEVRENIFQALFHLRSIGVTEPLWVDAICINQEDLQERGNQVRMMDSIYKLASRVRVWVGCATKGSSEAFQLISMLMTTYSEEDAKIMDARGESYRVQHNSNSYAEESLSNPLSNEYFTSDWEDIYLAQNQMDLWDVDYLESTITQKKLWEALVGFLERSYWTRIWIVQEYLLARDIIIHCGREVIDGRDLDMAFNSILRLKPEQHPEYPSYFKELIERINKSVGKRIIEKRHDRGKRALVDLLEATKHSKCVDPHDRIYAILGLASDISGHSFPVDYDRSIFKVKMDIAWFFKQRSRQPDISRICSTLDETFAGYPDGD